MKRVIAFITATVMMVVISPVVNADVGELNLTGEFSTTIDYQAEELTGESEFSLEAAMGETLRAGFTITGLNRPFSGDWENDGNISLDKMWLETQGPLIPGTSSIVTRLGGLDISYSPLIGIVGKNGISVDEIAFGPVSMGAFYAWDGPDRVQGARVGVSPSEMLEVQGSLVQADQNYYEVGATVAPVDFLEITGVYAAEEQGDHALKVDGSLQLLRDLEVRAGYRDITEGFNPLYGDPEYDDPDKPHYVPGQKGIVAGATLEQMGFVVKGDYAFYDSTLDFSATRPLNLAGMNFEALLEGVYKADVYEMSNLEAGVAYKAPNGLNLEASYDFILQQPKAALELNMVF